MSDYQFSSGTTKVNVSGGKLYTVIEKAPNGWSLIKIGGDEAWVPSDILYRRRKSNVMFEEGDDLYQNLRSLSFSKETENMTNEVNNNISIEQTENGSVEEHFVTIGAYVSSDESGISFKEDVDVVVLDKNESGWWYIKIGCDEGWAPSTYLKPSKKHRGVAKTIASGPDMQSRKIDISLGPPKPNRKSQVPQSYENFDLADGVGREDPARTGTALPSQKPRQGQKPENCNISPPVSELKVAFARQRKPPNIIKSQSVEDTRSPANEHFQTKLRKISEPAQKPPRPEKGPSPINSKGKVTPPVPTRPISVRQSPSPQDKGFRKTPPIPTRPTPSKGELFETICDYSDDDEGMLSFKVGEKVHVLEKDDGGWWLAMIGVKKGWVPSNFLVKL